MAHELVIPRPHNKLGALGRETTFCLDFRLAYFAACCICVGAVSVHDSILIILNDDVIFEVEQNPIGRWLIAIQNGSVHLFVATKLIGTALVCASLVTLHQHAQRIALAVASGLSIFQCILLIYLQTY